MKLCKCSHLCSILIWHTIEAKDSFIPAVSNCDLNFVFCIKQFCHIIDLILKTVVIACPARCHTVVSYSLSVQGRLVYSVCSCIQTGFLYLFIQCKCLSKYRAGSLLFREITCDHLRFKFCIVQHTSLKASCNLWYISVIICCIYLYFVELFIFQCCTFIRNQNRLIRRSFSTVPDNFSILICHINFICSL